MVSNEYAVQNLSNSLKSLPIVYRLFRKNMDSRMTSKLQQSSESYVIELINKELIPRAQSLNRPENDSAIEQHSKVLSMLSGPFRTSHTPHKKSQTDKNQSTQKPATPTLTEHNTNPYQGQLFDSELTDYRKTISQQKQIIEHLENLLSRQTEEHELQRKANLIYTDLFQRLKAVFNDDNISDILKKIERLKSQQQPLRVVIENQRSSHDTQGHYKFHQYTENLKRERQLELRLQIQRCQVTIQDLRNQLLRSSQNNIFALLNLPIPLHFDQKTLALIQKDYELCHNQNKRLLKQVTELKSQISQIQQQRRIQEQNHRRQIEQLQRIIQTDVQQSGRRVHSSLSSKDNLENIECLGRTNNSSSSQLKALVHLVEVLMEQQRDVKGKFDSLKSEVSSIFGLHKSKLVDVDFHGQLITELSERLKTLAQSLNTPQIAKIETLKSVENSYEPQAYINQIRALKQKVKTHGKQIELERDQKSQLQSRIEQIEIHNEIVVNESNTRVSRLQSKLKEKNKRILDLQNTIIDHIEKNSKKYSSVFDPKSDSVMVSPEVIQRYQNHIRNFKVLLNEARKETQQLREDLQQASEEKQKRSQAVKLLDDHLWVLKELYKKLGQSNFSINSVKQDLKGTIDFFDSEISVIRNRVSSLSENSRRRSIFFTHRLS